MLWEFTKLDVIDGRNGTDTFTHYIGFVILGRMIELKALT